MTVRILRKNDVLAMIGMGNTWLYEAMARGDFPRPVRLGSRAVGWRDSDVEQWLGSLSAASTAERGRWASKNRSYRHD